MTMRADRLITLLMLLQTRGRMTAQALAEDLEVSERTIYRDIDALSASGVPVYAERGPGGGCALLDNYRTSLTGLTSDEVRALFMLNIPVALDKLGVSQELRSALLKLSASLPQTRRGDEERTRQRIHLDSSWWFQGQEAAPHLQTLYQAVWQDRQLHLTLRLVYGPLPNTRIERTVAPYGLVAKSSVWYLVYDRDGRMDVCRVSQVLDAQLAEASFTRRDDFDLAAFWKDWCAEFEQARPRFPVKLRLRPGVLAWLPLYLDERMRAQLPLAAVTENEPVELTLTFETLEEARGRLLALGRAAEVLEPRELRLSLADYARQIAAVYAA
jgi:predicted DNA-binding transcriptional regulator YafY